PVRSLLLSARRWRWRRLRVSLNGAAHVRCWHWRSGILTRPLESRLRLGRDHAWHRRTRLVGQRLRQYGLIESQRRKLTVLTDRHLSFANFVRPLDVRDRITIHRIFCG